MPLLFETRRLASQDNRAQWEQARQHNITASDAALLARESSIPSVLNKKYNNHFNGNTSTQYGTQREAHIAQWVYENYGIAANNHLFHSATTIRHLATPDGLGLLDNNTLSLSEIKTTNKPFKTIPIRYLRQVWWQQYVLEAERTLFVWEEHKNFIPLHPTPEAQWIERDDEKIKELVRLADLTLERIDNSLLGIETHRGTLPIEEDEPNLPF